MGLLTSCQKEEETYSLQYKVIVKSGNNSDYSIHYLNPSKSTVITGVIDTIVWHSELFLEVAKGTDVRLEVRSDGLPKVDLIILKDNSLFAKQEVRTASDVFFISENL